MSHAVELLLLSSLGVTALLSALPRRVVHPWSFRLALVPVVLTALDIALGNWRWQILPAYALALALPAAAGLRAARPGLKGKALYAGGVLTGIVWLLAAVALPLVFPMFTIPAPSGPYGVGLMDIHLVDDSRGEDMTDDPTDRRELMVRAWYPADVPEGATPEPFLREIEPVHAIFSRGMPIPAFTFSHLKKIRSHSFLDAPVAASGGPFPVLVFSHGNSFYASQNSLLMEHLASHGYAVFSIDHPYQASWVRFPDGRVVTYKMDWMGDPELDPEEAQALLEAFTRALYADSYDEYYRLIGRANSSQAGANRSLRIWVDDTAYLLDELALSGAGRSEAIDAFAGRLDMGRIGIFGMSFGGATAGAFCSQDARCTAGLNMDGSQFGDNAMEMRLERPFMLMNADRRFDVTPSLKDEIDTSAPPSFEMNDFVYRQSNNVIYSLTVAGSTHGCFSDFGAMSRLGSWAGALGTIDGWAMKRILDDYTLAFFNKHILGTVEPLLDGPSDAYPDVVKFAHRDGRGQLAPPSPGASAPSAEDAGVD